MRNLSSVSRITSAEETQVVEHSAVYSTLKIKAKRSFRNVFHKRKPKSESHPVREQDPKRCSAAGSALTQCIRNSTNLSKASLAHPSEAKSKAKQDALSFLNIVEASGRGIDRQAAPSILEPGSAETSPEPTLVAPCNTASVIHKILDCVSSMGEESPDRLRGLEIAEVCIIINAPALCFMNLC